MVFAGRTDPLCPVCRGTIECKGGGNLDCRKRDPEPSVLAAVLDPYGGLGCVVTQDYRLKHHVRGGDVLVVVPNLTVHEPIAWNDIPFVIERIKLAVNAWIEERGQFSNDPNTQQVVKMYRLRCLEQDQESLNLDAIATT